MLAAATPPPPLHPAFQTSDIIAIGAAVVSFTSLFVTLYSSYLNKQLEIKFLKFGKLVIENIDQLFLPLNTIFSGNPTAPVSNYLTEITESLVDVELFIISFKTYYPTMGIRKISDSKDSFSDALYNNPTTSVRDSKIAYLAFKTYVYNELYEFARHNDIGPIHRCWAKLKSLSVWNFFNS